MERSVIDDERARVGRPNHTRRKNKVTLRRAASHSEARRSVHGPASNVDNGERQRKNGKRIALPLTADRLPPEARGTRKPVTGARFPSKVIDASPEHPPLVPGSRNKKMGAAVIQKGRCRGMGLFFLGLEEGRTCDETCVFLRSGLCNAANVRGHRFCVNQQLFQALDRQIASLLEVYPQGLVVRLHETGDFPNVGYIRFWSRMLHKYQELHLWGHTHRRGRLLNLILRELNRRCPGRALIRVSESLDYDYVAVTVPVIGRVTDWDGLVCPATLTRGENGPKVNRRGENPLAVCATCGACWNEGVMKVVWPLMLNGRGHLERSQKASLGE